MVQIESLPILELGIYPLKGSCHHLLRASAWRQPHSTQRMWGPEWLDEKPLRGLQEASLRPACGLNSIEALLPEEY